MGLFSNKKADKDKYLHGFAKTNNYLGKKLKFVTENKKQNKEDFMEQLMVTLIEADIGYKTSELICDNFFKMCKEGDKAFESTWTELKEAGYLKTHIFTINGSKSRGSDSRYLSGK